MKNLTCFLLSFLAVVVFFSTELPAQTQVIPPVELPPGCSPLLEPPPVYSQPIYTVGEPGLVSGTASRSGRLHWYADTGAGAAFLKVPKNTFFIRRGEVNPFENQGDLNTDDGKSSGYSVGGRLGLAWDLDCLEDTMMRVEFRGSTIQVEEASRDTFVDPGPGERFGFVLFNGNGIGTNNAGATNTLRTQINRETSFSNYELLTFLDRQVGDGGTTTLYGGFSFQNLNQDIQTFGQIATSINFSESINTDYTGGKLGLAHRQWFGEKWSLLLDGAVGCYQADTTYNVRFSDSLGGAGAVRLEDQNFALASFATMELSRQLGDHALFSIYTRFQHLNYAPEVNYRDVVTQPDAQPLSLQKGDLTSAVLGLKLVIWR